MKTMTQMHNEIYEIYRLAPKDKDGFPKLRCGGIGCPRLIWNKEEEKAADSNLLVGMLIAMGFGVFILGFALRMGYYIKFNN
jgi:hypothetical protein